MARKTKALAIYILVIFISSLYSQTGRKTLRRDIHERMKTQFVKPRHLTCLPRSKIHDKKLEKDIITALIKTYPEVKRDEIIHVIFTLKNWRINRNEFTSFIKSRYLFTLVVIRSGIPGQYYQLELNFMQNNRFMGWLWKEIYLQNMLSVDMIDEGHINKTCKQ
jgi:hypothetical protein